jgi:hypothetical protein
LTVDYLLTALQESHWEYRGGAEYHSNLANINVGMRKMTDEIKTKVLERTFDSIDAGL